VPDVPLFYFFSTNLAVFIVPPLRTMNLQSLFYHRLILLQTQHLIFPM